MAGEFGQPVDLHRAQDQAVVGEQSELLAQDNSGSEGAGCNGQDLDTPLQNLLRLQPKDARFLNCGRVRSALVRSKDDYHEALRDREDFKKLLADLNDSIIALLNSEPTRPRFLLKSKSSESTVCRL